DRIFHANEDARWVPDSERGPRCLKDSYSRSVSCASSVRVGNHFQIKLAAPGAHRQDVGFSPSECRSQREYLAEYSPGPVVDFVPQEGTDVEARQPAMTAVSAVKRELNIRLRVRLFHLRGNCVDQRVRESW